MAKYLCLFVFLAPTPFPNSAVSVGLKLVYLAFTPYTAQFNQQASHLRSNNYNVQYQKKDRFTTNQKNVVEAQEEIKKQ